MVYQSKTLEERFGGPIDLKPLAEEALYAVRTYGLKYVKERPVMHFHLDCGVEMELYTKSDIKAAQEKYVRSRKPCKR